MEFILNNTLLMLVTMNQYFDDKEFKDNPVKTELKTQYYNFKLGQSYV
jgi:hypothetical protein